MKGWMIAAAVAALLAGAPALGGGGGAAPISAPPQAIPVDLAVPFPPTPVNAEGFRHLIYELRLTNFAPVELSLRRIEVLDGLTGAVLAAWSEDALTGVLARPGPDKPADKTLIPGGQSAVAFLDVVTPITAPPLRALRHRLTFKPVMTVDLTTQSILEGAPVVPRSAPPVVLGAPLRGGCWIASHGLANASSHRRTLLALNGRATIAQRFAIDWIRVGADGQAFRGDPAVNRNWTPYGANVLAVADATVVEALDGVPENDPTSDKKAAPITLTTVGGNHLLLDIGGGRYVFYAHLQPGSLAVRVGDRVRRGQFIARLGNSGQSDAPHLHLHVVDGPSPLASEGLPLVFDSFWLQGRLPSLKPLTDGTGWKPTDRPRQKRREMPVENAVVAFGAGAPGQCPSQGAERSGR